MPYLDASYADRVRPAVGDRAADGITQTSDGTRPFLEGVAAGFKVQGAPSPVSLATDDPVIDVGGARPNEAGLTAPLVGVHDSAIGQQVEALVGYPVTKDNLAAALCAHRFVDAGATRLARRLTATICPAVYCVAIRPNGTDSDAVIVDGTGARLMPADSGSSTSLPQRLDAVTPERSSLIDADLENVYAMAGNRLRRVPVRDAQPAQLPVELGDGAINGSQYQQLTTSSRRNLDDAGPVPESAVAPPATVGSRAYVSTTSRIVGIGQNWSGGADAPPGFVWGAPTAPVFCSRSNRDECRNCCQNIALAYVGAAATAVISGALAGTVTVPGIGSVAGIVVGGIIGAILLSWGTLHFVRCRDSCDYLYRDPIGTPVRSQTFSLTAAVYDDDGKQVAYRVQTTNPDLTDLWSADQVMQFVWQRARVIADSGTEQASVNLVRKPNNGGFYLRSTGDKRVLNNLEALPPIV